MPGMKAPALDEEQLWDFSPSVKVGDELAGGDSIGTVPEGRLEHKILVPFSLGKVPGGKHHWKKQGEYHPESGCSGG